MKLLFYRSDFSFAVFSKSFHFWCFIFIAYFQVSAQDTYIRKISFLEGLPTQVIYDLHVGDNGLLYLGTNKGLISYNGVDFTEYPIDNNIALSLSYIKTDKNGLLWCMNFSNQLFYLENNKLIVHERVQEFLKDSDENLLSYFFDTKNRLNFSTEYRILRIEEGEIIELFKTTDKSQYLHNSQFDEKTNEIIFSSKNYVFFLDENSNLKKVKVDSDQKEIVVGNDIIYALKGFRNQVYDLSGMMYDTSSMSERAFVFHFSTIEDEIWLATTDGIHLLDTKNRTIKNSILRGTRVSDIVQDKEGNRWVSSLDDGLYFVPNQGIKEIKLKDKNNKPVKKYMSLAKDDSNNFFVGATSGEIIELNSKSTEKFIYYSTKEREVEFIYLDNDLIFSSVGMFERAKKEPIIDNYFGKHMTKDNRGNYITANYNRAGIFPTSLKGKPNLPPNFSDKNLEPFLEDIYISSLKYKRSKVVHFCEDSETYYVGSSDGFFYYGMDGVEREIKEENGDPIIVSSLVVISPGNYWVSTSQNGVFRIENNQVKESFSEQDGLSSEKIMKINLDKNFLWIATARGFDRLNLTTKEIDNFKFNLGFKGVTINDFLIDDDNQFWFATSDGLIVVPNEIFTPISLPNVNVSAINQNGDKLLPNSKVSYKNKNLAFDLGVIFFKSLGEYEYEYRMLPIQEEWQQQSAKVNVLNFLSLASGDYDLQVRLRSGVNVSEITSFSFSILPPYWLSSWFLFLVFAGLLFIFFIVYRAAVDRTRSKEMIKEQLAISQLTALRTQMNPHFMFNVLNAVQGLIYSNQKIKANEYIGTFSELMRKTLDVSDKKEVSIAQEMSTIDLYVQLEKARFDDGDFEYVIQCPSDIDLEDYVIPSLIIQPFVENAIKHGLLHKKGKKLLQLNLLSFDKERWAFEIIDNGVGRCASEEINRKLKKHTSFATNAIDTRIDLINKLSEVPIEIQVEDLVGKLNEALGTKVTLIIPKIKR